ncbi:hypothetical protein MBM_09393 [Drepanopeziza brunnea f. sp. 'multigermtubi' MB_m1]|uniref:Uncharacterized protein n=1 Tax=Marssonina brunnea f. sp. multigermtubi (strain MB_m1) TaxID=1072389 RepID=K1XIP7_MARBU|nr:uncharacterized protein MBM_09393 [Drepanopeziza brunnea f. sp. 'multigermtubi' MB_m1]EKD12359.1 hypothetical protein MBM_09393 [Drepanopeziza brunnea f. sp. 'multigermtubi' MB_m1]
MYFTVAALLSLVAITFAGLIDMPQRPSVEAEAAPISGPDGNVEAFDAAAVIKSRSDDVLCDIEAAFLIVEFVLCGLPSGLSYEPAEFFIVDKARLRYNLSSLDLWDREVAPPDGNIDARKCDREELDNGGDDETGVERWRR